MAADVDVGAMRAGFSKARLGRRGGELRSVCPGEEPAVGVLEGGDLRRAGAGEGVSRSLF